jgi:hypothetical protein
MNERYEQLMAQAWIEFAPDVKAVTKRFAELIVRECAQIAVFKDSGTVATADVAGHMAAGRSIAARLIKEHFGVEE